MSGVQLVQSAVGLSLMLIVLSLGMRCSWSEATYLLREPGLLLRSLLAMNVLLPLAAVLLVVAWPLEEPVKVALLTLAVSPVPPILPSKELKLVTREDYVWSLFIFNSVLALIFVPLLVSVVAAVFNHQSHMTVALVAKPVVISVLAPLLAGMLVRQFWRSFAQRARGMIAVIGNILLLAASLVILVAVGPELRRLLGDGTLLAFAALTSIGLLIGHLLGGPVEENRSVLALATATRHPGIAIAIGAAGFPGDKLIPAAVLLALLVSVIASIPYTTLRKRKHQRASGAGD